MRLLVTIRFLPLSLSAQSVPAELDRYLANVLQQWQIPGLAVAVVRNDSTLIAKGEAPGPIMLQGEEQKVEWRNLTISVPVAGASVPPSSAACANDSLAVAFVRARLAEWVRQANAGDQQGMNEVWAPGLVGWFPRAGVFADSSASRLAGVEPGTGSARATFDLVIDDIQAAGSIVVVHDLWTERRDFPNGKRVTREIRGSELWRCQPDGRWRIARYVSAPEPWRMAQ